MGVLNDLVIVIMIFVLNIWNISWIKESNWDRVVEY